MQTREKHMNISGKSIVCSVFSVLVLSGAVTAQKWVNPNFDAQRLDYRDLGYPGANEIEADNSPITALLSHTNGKVYGATSGDQSYLFFFDRTINKVRPLGKIPASRGVHHCLLEGGDGKIFIGTGLNILEQVILIKNFPGGQRAIENQLWEDIKAPYKAYEGGHIFVYDPVKGDAQTYLPEDKCPVEDLGIPMKGNSIYAMTWNKDRTKIVGITYPDAHFFMYDLKIKKAKDYGKLLSVKVYSGPERTWRSVPRALVCAKNGNIYTSGDHGLMVYYDQGKDALVKTSMRIPGEYYETWNYYGYPVIEQLIEDVSGMIFGSTSDGFIFSMDPSEEKIVTLGKPRLSRRVRAMTRGNDNRLYMICGEFQEPCKMYSYDMSGKEGFFDMGVLGVDRSPYYAKRPYQFDAMAVGIDGSIFIGESERRAKLFIYIPGARVYDGILNPNNPRYNPE